VAVDRVRYPVGGAPVRRAGGSSRKHLKKKKTVKISTVIVLGETVG